MWKQQVRSYIITHKVDKGISVHTAVRPEQHDSIAKQSVRLNTQFDHAGWWQHWTLKVDRP